MSKQSVVLEGIVGSDAHGISVRHHRAHIGQDRYLACIGLRDGANVIWQEIEMTREVASLSTGILADGNIVRIFGHLEKQLGWPVYRVQVETVELLHGTIPAVLRNAA